MDVNYLLAREQVSLMKAAAATSNCVRLTHQGFAKAYRHRIHAVAFPHMRRSAPNPAVAQNGLHNTPGDRPLFRFVAPARA